MLIKVIEGHGKNPLIYFNGRLLSSEQYTFEEIERAPAMLGWAGVYEPLGIRLNEEIITGDVLIIVYPTNRYEYTLKALLHRGTRINLRPESPVKNG